MREVSTELKPCACIGMVKPWNRLSSPARIRVWRGHAG